MFMVPDELLGVQGLATMPRATHIQACPGQPSGDFIAGFFTVKSPANRVRGATCIRLFDKFTVIWFSVNPVFWISALKFPRRRGLSRNVGELLIVDLTGVPNGIYDLL